MATSALFGTDVLFEDGDVVVGPGGDLVGVSGRDCLMQDIVTLLSSSPGSLLSSSTAGVGIQDFINQDNSAVNRIALINQITDRLEDDPRVLECQASVKSWTLDSINVRLQITPIDESSPLNLLLTITSSGIEVA